jgi:thioredoxin-related protein
MSGLHLNLTTEQFKILAKKHGISAIPHYLLFDQQGKLQNGNAPGPDNADLLYKQITTLLN